MILWLNGPFGAGKTTTVRELLRLRPDLAVFDTELLGYALRPALTAQHPVRDFQDWQAWRTLVVTALTEIAEAPVSPVLVPQTVLVEQYWDAITGPLVDRGVDVTAVTLHVEAAEHLRRIEADMLSRPETDPGRISAARWRRERRRDYDAAVPWLRGRTTMLDTTHLEPAAVAQVIRSAID